MGFKKVDTQKLPPRRWALVGPPDSGKTTFLNALRQPTLIIDADGRRHEQTHRQKRGALKNLQLFELSPLDQDHRSPQRIQDLLNENMPDMDEPIGTIAIDSVTSYISPSVIRAVLDNDDAAHDEDKVRAYADKANRMKLLQDVVTGWGTDVVFIWHAERGHDGTDTVIRESLSSTERERLFRSLNAVLQFVVEGGRHGVYVQWSREGRSSTSHIFWDEQGEWMGVPERVEEFIYNGGQGDASGPAEPDGRGFPFDSARQAQSWAVERRAFRDQSAAQAAYERLRAQVKPTNKEEMFTSWQRHVDDILTSARSDA
jgi:type II secretory pathway component PulJ